MGAEVGVAGVAVPPEAKRRRVLAAKPTAEGAGGKRPRRARRPQGALQRLFQACRAVFRGPGTVPAPAEVDLLRVILDRMRPEDVGLSSDMAFFRTRDVAQRNPTITHTTIYKSEKFSMVILFLPQNAVIPLHNHPGMTVFSKLLLGSMHIKSYDWADPDAAGSGASSPDKDRCRYLSHSAFSPKCLILLSNTMRRKCAITPRVDLLAVRLAELVVDDDFTAPCDTSVLYPTAGGNMHRFRSIAPCAILDILGPPYSIEEDRDCTYYTDVPYSEHTMTGTEIVRNEQGDRRLAWLKEIEMPGDLKMCSVRYGGPQVSER